jgi:hypothetical protein
MRVSGNLPSAQRLIAPSHTGRRVQDVLIAQLAEHRHRDGRSDPARPYMSPRLWIDFAFDQSLSDPHNPTRLTRALTKGGEPWTTPHQDSRY